MGEGTSGLGPKKRARVRRETMQTQARRARFLGLIRRVLAIMAPNPCCLWPEAWNGSPFPLAFLFMVVLGLWSKDSYIYSRVVLAVVFWLCTVGDVLQEVDEKKERVERRER